MNLKICQWNVRGFSSNKPFITKAIEQIKPNIITLQETIAKPQTNLNIPNFYCAARYDRPTKGGGTAILVHRSVPSTPFKIQTDLEVAVAKIHLPRNELTVASLYLPPTLEDLTIAPLLDFLINSLPHPYIITTDANAHHTWGSHPRIEEEQ